MQSKVQALVSKKPKNYLQGLYNKAHSTNIEMQEEKWRQEKKHNDIQCTLHKLQRRHQELLDIHDKVQETNNNMQEKKVWEEKHKELPQKKMRNCKRSM